ncbi:TPA: hypothetical protein ACH3X1_002519 [Trebouxia sp. C0004]
MDEDSDWGSWGLDPAVTRIQQQQQQQQQQSSVRPGTLHVVTPGETTLNSTAAARPTSSNGNVKPASKKMTSRQSSITRLSTIATQQSPPADPPADAHFQKLPLRQTSDSSRTQTPTEPALSPSFAAHLSAQVQKPLTRPTHALSEPQKTMSKQASGALAHTAPFSASRAASQGSPSAANDWQSLLADTTAAPIKVQASKARPTRGPPKLQGAVSTYPSSATGKATSGPTPTVTASPASQSAQSPSTVSAGHTDVAGSTAAGHASGIASEGPKTSSRAAGQRAISLRSVSSVATAKSGVESIGPAGAGPDDLRPVAPSITDQAAAKPLRAAAPLNAKGLPSGSRPARQRLELFGASQALPDAMPGAAASKADQAAEAPQAMSGRASISSASTAASERYSKFMAALPGRGQLPERGQEPRTAAAQIQPFLPKEGTSSSTSRAETSLPDAPHSSEPGQGPPSSVKPADLSLPKGAGFPSASTGLRQATAAEAVPAAETAAAPGALSATPAANTPSAPSTSAAAAAAAAAAERSTATEASASAGSSTAADSHTPASQTAATNPKLRPSSKSADGAKPSLHADVRPATSARAAGHVAAAVNSPAADIITAPAEPDESYQQQAPSVFSNSSLAADSTSTADIGATDLTPSVSTAVRDASDAAPSNSTAESTAAAAIPFATFGSSSQAHDDADDFFAAAGDTPPTVPASRPSPSTAAAAELPQYPLSAAAIDPLPTFSTPSDASSSGIQPQKQLQAVGPGNPNAGAVRPPQRALLPARHRGSDDAAVPQPPFLQQATAAAPAASMPEDHAEAPAVSSAASGGSAVAATGTAPAAAAAKPRNKADVLPPPSLIATDRTMPTAVDPAANIQAEAAFSAAGQAVTFGGTAEPTFVPSDKEKEEEKAEHQSGFVPIPFGGSSSRPSFAGTAAAAPFGSHADMHNTDDSFFDSIGTGVSVAVASLADELQSQSGLISPHPTEPTPLPCHPQQLQLATELSVPASAAASPVSHKDTGGAHMSQELPSFHDWGQAGNLSSASVKSPQAADSAPQLPAQLPVQPQQQLPEAAETLSDVLSQQEEVPDELMALQPAAAQQAAVAVDPLVGFDDRQQGDSPQRQAFTIPFSGQSELFAEEEDYLFGAGPSHKPGPFDATAPPSALPASEPSFTFDEVDSQSQQQSNHTQSQHDVSSHVMLTQLSHQQQQQHPSQDTATWPESQSHSQPQPLFPAESQYQSQYLLQPQTQSPNQSQSQVSAAHQSQGQPQLPFHCQPQAQSQGHSQSQAGLFAPARQSSYGHAQAQAPQFMPQSSANQGIAYCQPPSIPSLPFQQGPSMPPSLPFQQFPSTIPSPPFQQPGPAHTPWDSIHTQSQMLNSSLPLQLSVNTQRLSSPHAVYDGQQSQPDVYDEGALWPGLHQVAAVEQPQQQGQSMWPHQAASAETAVESHATAGQRLDPNIVMP